MPTAPARDPARHTCRSTASGDTGCHGCGQPKRGEIAAHRGVPLRCLQRGARLAAGRPGRDRQGRFLARDQPVDGDVHRSAMRARSREEKRRVPLSDFDSLESSSPISWAKARRLRPDASIRLSTRSGMPCMTARLAEDLRKSQNCPMMGTAAAEADDEGDGSVDDHRGRSFHRTDRRARACRRSCLRCRNRARSSTSAAPPGPSPTCAPRACRAARPTKASPASPTWSAAVPGRGPAGRGTRGGVGAGGGAHRRPRPGPAGDDQRRTASTTRTRWRPSWTRSAGARSPRRTATPSRRRSAAARTSRRTSSSRCAARCSPRGRTCCSPTTWVWARPSRRAWSSRSCCCGTGPGR